MLRYHYGVLQICNVWLFAKNALFLSSGITCLPLMVSTLRVEVSTDKRNNISSFETKCVHLAIAPVKRVLDHCCLSQRATQFLSFMLSNSMCDVT